MKAYDSIESLAEGMKVSSRTGWRWLKSGKVVRKRAEGGGFTFILKEGANTDTTDNDMDSDNVVTSPSDNLDTVEDETEGEIVSRPSRRRLLKRGVHVAHPSPELKRERESTESLKLELERAKIGNELKRVTRSETEEETGRKRERWIQRWISFALQFFDEDIDLETKIGVEKLVSNLLKDVSVDEDSEAIRLMIQKKIMPMAEKYFQKYLPLMKEALISYVLERLKLRGLLTRQKEEIKRTIREVMERDVVGYEDEQEWLDSMQAAADVMADENVSWK